MIVGHLSNYSEEKVLDHVLRNIPYSPASTIYVGLLTSLSADGASFVEVGVSGYSRQSIAFGAASGGQVQNTNNVQFPAALADWGSIPYIGLFDSASGGNLLMWGEFTIAKFVAQSAVFKIDASEMTVESKGAFSLYLRNNILELFLRNNSFSSPSSIYAGVGAVVGSNNASISEPSGAAGYARDGAVVFTTPGDGTTANAVALSYLANGSNWGEINSAGYYDALTNGNLLFVITLDDPRIIYDGDGIDFDANALDLRVK